MSDTPDLSKIVGLIMENPKLISEIQSLVKSDGGDKSGTLEPAPESESESVPAVSYNSALSQESSAGGTISKREKRARLFSGLKPYLSSGRQRTVDTVLTFADILETVKGK